MSQDIAMPQYIQSRNRWEVHYSFTDTRSKFKKVHDWCWETFGHPGTDPDTEVKGSWDYRSGWIYLFDEASVMLFLLRWS